MREYVYTCDNVCVNFYVCILGFYANTFTQDIFALEFAGFILTHIVFFFCLLALEFNNVSMFHITLRSVSLCNLLLNCTLFPFPHAMLSSPCLCVSKVS